MEIVNKLRINGREISGAEIGQVLENDIFKLLNRAELLLEENPNLGKQLFYQAKGLYRWHGSDRGIVDRVDEVFLLYNKRGLIPEA